MAGGISENVERTGRMAMGIMNQWKQEYPDAITDVRGAGLLLMIEFKDDYTATRITDECLEKRLFVRQTQGSGIRIFPALNIKKEELEEGLTIFKEAIDTVKDKKVR